MKRCVLSLVVLALFATFASAITHHAYVTNASCNCITVIDTSTKQVVASIPTFGGYQPTVVAVHPFGNPLYVGLYNVDDPSVMVVNTQNNSVITTIHLAAFIPHFWMPAAFATTLDGSTLYVMTNAGASSATVAVVRTSDNSVTKTFTTSGQGDIALLPNGSRAYLPNQNCCEVDVVRTSDKTVIATIPFGHELQNVAVTSPLATNQRVYVTDRLNDTVTVIDPSTNTVVATIRAPHAPANDPTDVAVNPQGATPTVYFIGATRSELYFVDSVTNTIFKTVALGTSTPWAIAITRDGAEVWITNFYDNTVSVVDGSSGSIIATIPLGGTNTAPFGIAIN